MVKGATADADHNGVEQSGRWSGVVYVLRLVSLGYLAAAASLLFWSHAPQVVGWQPRVVLTGSMLPTVRPGDVALVAPAPATVGRAMALPPVSTTTVGFFRRKRAASNSDCATGKFRSLRSPAAFSLSGSPSSPSRRGDKPSAATITSASRARASASAIPPRERPVKETPAAYSTATPLEAAAARMPASKVTGATGSPW